MHLDTLRYIFLTAHSASNINATLSLAEPNLPTSQGQCAMLQSEHIRQQHPSKKRRHHGPAQDIFQGTDVDTSNENQRYQKEHGLWTSLSQLQWPNHPCGFV